MKVEYGAGDEVLYRGKPAKVKRAVGDNEYTIEMDEDKRFLVVHGKDLQPKNRPPHDGMITK